MIDIFTRAPNIVHMEYGSRLYGTSTPASDTDYAKVFMPTMEELLLQRGLQSKDKSTGKDHEKNGSEDVDDKVFSLHAFLRLCLSGDTTALDMLHCDQPLSSSSIFDELRANRTKFYTKKMKAYVGYVKDQALKYGVKGDKVNELKVSIEYLLDLDHINPKMTLADCWEGLPEGEYITKGLAKDEKTRVYFVLGKQYEESVTVDYAFSRLQKKLDSYGKRAKIAAENNGMDWKAIHHSLRVMYQCREILERGDFHYPLAETKFLMRVKRGDVNYLKEVAPEFDKFLDGYDELAEKSGFPDEPDVEYWEKWLVGVYDEWFKFDYKGE